MGQMNHAVEAPVAPLVNLKVLLN